MNSIGWTAHTIVWKVEIPSNKDINPIIMFGWALNLGTENMEMVTNIQAIMEIPPTIANTALKSFPTWVWLSRYADQAPIYLSGCKSDKVLFNRSDWSLRKDSDIIIINQ